MKLDADSWKTFRFGDLISDIYKAQAHSKCDLFAIDFPKNGYIPFVSRTEDNNCVDCYVSLKDDITIEAGNALTFGDTTATIAYQPDNFTTGDHIVVVRAGWLNEYTGAFITTLLKIEKFRYSYGRAFKMDFINNTFIKLPVNNDGKPDWKWMENYVKSLHSEPIKTANISCSLDIDTTNWNWFKLGGESGLFDIKKGKRLTSED